MKERPGTYGIGGTSQDLDDYNGIQERIATQNIPVKCVILKSKNGRKKND